MSIRYAFAFASILALATPALADDMSKEACVDAHSRGQDARDQGKLSLARKLFLQCAQSGCPGVVQGDCARFADDLTRMQPTIAFAARDTAGNDLPDTTVYVDDILIVTRLDDGKPHDVDPGKHLVKFSNGGRDQIVTVVVGTGEKGRTVVGTFPALGGAANNNNNNANNSGSSTTRPDPVSTKPTKSTTHPGGSKAVIGLGAVMAVGGAGLAVWGRMSVPDNCNVSTRQCAASPGSKDFSDAKAAMNKFNIGVAVGAVGVAALAGGLVWYFKGAQTTETEPVAMPYVTPDGQGGGFAVSGRF